MSLPVIIWHTLYVVPNFDCENDYLLVLSTFFLLSETPPKSNVMWLWLAKHLQGLLNRKHLEMLCGGQCLQVCGCEQPTMANMANMWEA